MHDSSPWGKFLSTDKRWGPHVPHVLSWLFMESPPVYIGVLFLMHFNTQVPIYNKFLASFMILHYAHRALIYPLRLYAGNAAKDMPLSMPLFAFMFCTYNTILQNTSLLLIGKTYANEETVLLLLRQNPLGILSADIKLQICAAQMFFGLFLFVGGMIINITSDNILLNLKKKSKNKKYSIPVGGMFEYVSCAHYFGEIIEWFGWFVLCHNISVFSFFFFTLMFLTVRALNVHKWYQHKFDTYPKDRKACIPFVI